MASRYYNVDVKWKSIMCFPELNKHEDVCIEVATPPEFNADTKEDALHKSESLIHNKRQQMHEAYYKAISADKMSDNQQAAFVKKHFENIKHH